MQHGHPIKLQIKILKDFTAVTTKFISVITCMSTLKLLSAYSHITNTVLRFNENKKLILVLSVQSEQTGAPTE